MGRAITDPNRISIAEAARDLGMSQDTFRQCMQQNLFPFPVGMVVKKQGAKHFTYIVYRAKIEELTKFWGLCD